MKRLDVLVSGPLDREIREIARESGIEHHDVLRRSLAVLKAFRDARARGIRHLGFVADAGKLDIEVTNVL